MYYVIETEYVGPNQDQHVNDHTVIVSTAPAHTNMSREARTRGWCGTTNDWATYAHGEYATVDGAIAAIWKIFDEVRDSLPNGDDFPIEDEHVLKIFKPGKYEQMTREATGDFVVEALKNDIEASTTDDQLAHLATAYEDEANSEGYTLHHRLTAMLEDHRQDLRDEEE